MFTRVCLSIFREVTYVDSEGIGWSINFSDTGGGGYGCINGCVISSPSKTKVHRSQNIFPRTHRMVVGQVDRARDKSKKRFPSMKSSCMTRGMTIRRCIEMQLITLTYRTGDICFTLLLGVRSFGEIAVF